MATWLLIHNPLVGPVTWRKVAAELRCESGAEKAGGPLPGRGPHSVQLRPRWLPAHLAPAVGVAVGRRPRHRPQWLSK